MERNANKKASLLNKNIKQDIKEQSVNQTYDFNKKEQDVLTAKEKQMARNGDFVFDNRSEIDNICVLEGDKEGTEILNFSGDDNFTVAEFFTKFEDYLIMQPVPWTDTEKAIKIRIFLTKRAREVYNNIENKESYTTVKDCLIKAFQTQRSKEKAEDKLEEIQKRKEETVSDFSVRLTKAVKAVTDGKGKEVFEEKLLREFLKRLDHPLKYLVRGLRPKTFEDALDIAEEYEYTMPEESSQPEVVNTLTTCSIKGNEGKTSDHSFRLQQSRAIPQQTYRWCGICGLTGHRTEECWKSRRSRGTSLIRQDNQEGWTHLNGRFNTEKVRTNCQKGWHSGNQGYQGYHCSEPHNGYNKPLIQTYGQEMTVVPKAFIDFVLERDTEQAREIRFLKRTVYQMQKELIARNYK